MPTKRAKLLLYLFMNRDKTISDREIREELRFGGGTLNLLHDNLVELNLITNDYKLVPWVSRCMVMIMSMLTQWSNSIGYYIHSKRREKKLKKDIGIGVPDWVNINEMQPLDLHYISKELSPWVLQCMDVIMSSIPQWRSSIGYYIYIEREGENKKKI